MSELRELILQEYSKDHSIFIGKVLKQKPNLIPELLDIIYLEEEPVSRRAAWSLRLLFDDSPSILAPFYDDLIVHLGTIKLSAILRAVLAIISKIKIEEKWYPFLLQYTTDAILSSQTEIATKAFSMDIFFQIAKSQPDLFYELEQMIEHIYPDASKGVQNKCRNQIKWIEKMRAKARN
jgi:hypothetical protein